MQSLVRLTDAAMTGQPCAIRFPNPVSERFPPGAGLARVGADHAHDRSGQALNPAGTPMTLYLRVAPRGMTRAAARPPEQKDSKDKKKKDADSKAAPPPPSPTTRSRMFAPIEPHPSAPGPADADHARHRRAGGQLRSLRRPAASADRRRRQDGRAETAARRAQLRRQFSTSSVILAERVDAAAAADDTGHSSRTTRMRSAEPRSSSRRITNSGKRRSCIVLLQIYNPTITPDKKFDLEATYTFYRQEAGRREALQRDRAAEFTPETLGPSFDPSAGDSSIQAGQGIPLQSFPDGSYRLEIKITDKARARENADAERQFHGDPVDLATPRRNVHARLTGGHSGGGTRRTFGGDRCPPRRASDHPLAHGAAHPRQHSGHRQRRPRRPACGRDGVGARRHHRAGHHRRPRPVPLIRHSRPATTCCACTWPDSCRRGATTSRRQHARRRSIAFSCTRVDAVVAADRGAADHDRRRRLPGQKPSTIRRSPAYRDGLAPPPHQAQHAQAGRRASCRSPTRPPTSRCRDDDRRRSSAARSTTPRLARRSSPRLPFSGEVNLLTTSARRRVRSLFGPTSCRAAWRTVDWRARGAGGRWAVRAVDEPVGSVVLDRRGHLRVRIAPAATTTRSASRTARSSIRTPGRPPGARSRPCRRDQPQCRRIVRPTIAG